MGTDFVEVVVRGYIDRPFATHCLTLYLELQATNWH
jgi:hypothetical protein